MASADATASASSGSDCERGRKRPRSKPKALPAASNARVSHLRQLFDCSASYLDTLLPPGGAAQTRVRAQRLKQFDALLPQFHKLDDAAADLLAHFRTRGAITDHVAVTPQGALEIGRREDLSDAEFAALEALLRRLHPWKKGPLRVFGIEIDTEWRSDWKWDRIKPHLAPLRDKVVADVGCANGYFMFRALLEAQPKMVVGVDPNVKAWLEFQVLNTFAGRPELQLEVLDGNETHFPHCFDVVLCLGVLYHTTDPVGMLRALWRSMKPRAQLIVDCQGIPGDDPVALVPRRAYARAGGIWFLPTRSALETWLHRANFREIECFFAEQLSTDEQRATTWANIPSLEAALDPTDASKTVEGYPAPHRFYMRAIRG